MGIRHMSEGHQRQSADRACPSSDEEGATAYLYRKCVLTSGGLISAWHWLLIPKEKSYLLVLGADLLGSYILVCYEITLGVDLIISIFSRRLTLRCRSLWAVINSPSHNFYITHKYS